VPFFGRATGLQKSVALAVGDAASATADSDMVETLSLIAISHNVMARGGAGKLSFGCEITTFHFHFACPTQKA
jgi:hypothetical protein